MSIFISNLAPSLDDFISFKNALGIEYKTTKVYLPHSMICTLHFDNYYIFFH